MKQLKKEQCRDMMRYVAEKIVENEPYLTEIDLKIGDGDHGTGMKRGFSHVIEVLKDYEPKTAEDVFRTVGITLLDTMGGASGVLFGTVFISGLTKRTEKEYLELQDFADIFGQSLEALKKRGRAKVGDKTMVDALEPAVEALKREAEQGEILSIGLNEAEKAAKEGVEYTKKVKARFGRAKYFGGKAIGLQDAGATSVWIMFQAMNDWVQEVNKEEQ